MVVVGGSIIGVLFCLDVYDAQCALLGVPYLQAITAGIGVVGFIAGLGGSAGLGIRTLIALKSGNDLNERDQRRNAFGAAILSIVGLVSFVILIFSI